MPGFKTHDDDIRLHHDAAHLQVAGIRGVEAAHDQHHVNCARISSDLVQRILHSNISLFLT
jgi:hypothetical protein